MTRQEAQQKFIALFPDAMSKEEGMKPLVAFIGGLTPDNLEACFETYFSLSQKQSKTDMRSLRVFHDLSAAALDKGDAYFALKYESVIEAKQTRWWERFNALEPVQQKKLRAAAARKRSVMTHQVKEFLRLFEKYMKPGQQSDKEISNHVFKQGHSTQYDCLRAYLQVSTRYPDSDAKSLRIFWALSSLCLAKGDALFAAKYETRIKTAGTLYNSRFGALDAEWRNELTKQIGQKKKDLKVEDKEAATDAKDRKKTRLSAQQQEFLNRFAAHMRKPDPKGISEYIFKLDRNKLRECLVAYLKNSVEYKLNEHSLYVFFGLSSLAIAKSESYYAFKYDHLIKTAGTVWAEHFAALSDTQKKVINDDLAKKRREARFFDELKFAYYQKCQKDPDILALQKFEPEVNRDQRAKLMDVLSDCEHNFNVHKPKEFLKGFDALSDLLHAQKDALLLFAMLKWIREADQVSQMVRDELYWYGVAAYYLFAAQDRALVYVEGFSDEEMSYLLSGDRTRGLYFADFEQRLDYIVWKKRGRKDVTDIAKAHAVMLLFADLFQIRLVPVQEATRVRELVETLRTKEPRSVDELRIPVNAPLFKGAQLRIGQTIGDVWIIWWDEKTDTAYIEVNHLERVLFSVNAYFKLGRLYQDDATYGEVWRNTQHLMVLIPAFFDLLGYLPDLMTGGFTGLIKGIVVDYVAEKITTAAVGDSLAGNIVMSGLLDAATTGKPKGGDVPGAHMTGNTGTRAALAAEVRATGATDSDPFRTVPLKDPVAGVPAGQGASTPGDTTSDTRPPPEGPPEDPSRKAPDAPGDNAARAQQKAIHDAMDVRLRGVTPPSRMLPPGRISAAAQDTAEQLGLDAVQVQAISEVLDVRFTKLRGFAAAWNRVATANADRVRAIQDLFATQLTKREIAERARDTFGYLRTQFWSYVGNSHDLAAREIRDQLRHAGFEIAQDGTAPFVRLRGTAGNIHMRLDVDHIKELGSHPVQSVASPGNFRLAPGRENTVVLNQLHSRDPFQPDMRMTSGRGTSRAGQLHGDPGNRRGSPSRGLLPDPTTPHASGAARADAEAAIDEAFRRLDELAPNDVF